MRRHQPAVKRGRTCLGHVRDDQLRVHHPSRNLTMSRGSLTTPPNPLLRSRRHASVSLGGGAVHQEHPAGLSAALQARPLPRAPPRDLDWFPAPDCGGGQGMVWLSDQRLQLLFVQLGSEFPFHSLCHLLPRAPSGFHIFEDHKRLRQRAVCHAYGLGLACPKRLGHFSSQRVLELLWTH